MTEYACPECDTIWNTKSAADACAASDLDGDELTGFDPNRHRLSYRLSYD